MNTHGGTEEALLSLIHRALVERLEDAWSDLYAQFAPLVLFWITRHPLGQESFADEGPDAVVNAVFLKLWVAARRGVTFSSLAAFCTYLRACSVSALHDWRRSSASRPRQEVLFSTLLPSPDSLYSSSLEASELAAAAETEVMDALALREVFELIQAGVRSEKELVVVTLALLCGLAPATLLQLRLCFPPELRNERVSTGTPKKVPAQNLVGQPEKGVQNKDFFRDYAGKPYFFRRYAGIFRS